MRKIILTFVLLALAWPGLAQNVAVSGAVVGNGSYLTLTAAFAAINSGSQTGATITVSILANTNEGSGTAVLNAGTWTALQVVPSGAPRSIIGATMAGQALLQLEGADNVTFNGQLAGNVRGLTLENTTASSQSGTCTVLLRSDATSNTFSYCNLLGASRTLGVNIGATVVFGAGAGSQGNDNNTIRFCDIGPSGSNLPTKAIYSSGGAGFNSSILITNCNLYDYFQPTIDSDGIYLFQANLYWTIQNNRFYQTAPRHMTGASFHRDIVLNSFLGNYGHSITGNTFGYASSAGTGLSVYRSSVSNAHYIPIDVPAADDYGPSFLNNNVIAGISFPALSIGDLPMSFFGIRIQDGIIGSHSNTIGSSTVAGSISMTNAGGGNATFTAIRLNVGSTGIGASNNVIGGFQLDAPSGGSISFWGIRGNNVQTINSNSILNNQIGFAAAPIVVNGSGAGDRVIGIDGQGPNLEVSGNTVAYLSSRTSSVSISNAAGVIGILAQGNGSSDYIFANQVTALSSTHPSAAVTVIGISGFGTDETRRNLVQALSATSPNAKITGIHVGLGYPGVHSNNMVRLGRNALGQSLTHGITITGIYEDAGFHDFIFNSVYIGGDNVVGSAQTYAFYGIGSSTTRKWRNNIFYNARSNGAMGTGLHFAAYNATNSPNTSPSSNGNDFYVTGNGGRFGYIYGQEVLTLPIWQALTSVDANSICSNPNYVNPDGNATAGDLHIGPVSPIQAAGQPFTAVPIDYDNQARNNLTPVDIGADAGNFQAQTPQLPEVLLTGNGQSIADGDLTPATADGTDFGNGYCEVQQPRQFVIQNTGAAPLIISAWGFSGPGASQFSIVVPPPGLLQPGQAATFSLAYTASVVGAANAQFNLSCNDWDETFYNFAIQGSSLGDTAPPVAVCNALNLYVGSGGSVAVSAVALAAGSTDNCGIANYSATPSTFNCSQRGPRSVTVQMADNFGLQSTCTAMVMVVDSTRPQALCRTLSATLDAGGQATLTAAQFNNGSMDNCGIDSLWASAAQFDCSDLGLNLVTLSVRDQSGNVGTCTAQLSILDPLLPLVTCQSATLWLDGQGQAVLNPTSIEAASSDNCGVVLRTVSTGQFTCAQLGTSTVTLTVADVSGNAATCQAQVTVIDTTRPVSSCASASLYLDVSGMASLVPSSVASGTDNCGIATTTLSRSQFTCGDVGPQTVLATFRDLTGNADSCTTTLTVLDTLAPVLACQNTTVSVGSSGTTAITTALVLASSGDNCGIDTLFLSRTSVGCADAGVVSVTVSALDIQGNLATCTALVTVQTMPLGVTASAPAPTCGHHISCAGMTLDSVQALVQGGCAPYTYAWSNGQTGAVATGLGAGTHSVTVTDGAGATAVHMLQLSAPNALIAAPAIGQTPCGQDSTGSLSVAGSGGNDCQPYSYLWSNGATTSSPSGLPAGTYQVSITDVAGCTSTASITLPALPTPQPLVSQSDDTLFASPGFFFYQWSFNGQPITGATAFFHVPIADGFYTVTVSDNNGCSGTSTGYPYIGIANAPGRLAGLGLQVFPNPSDGRFALHSDRVIDLPVRLALYDLSGKVLAVWSFPDLAEQKVLDLQGLAAGSYLLHVEVEEGPRQVIRLVVR
jgi:hypothetical protein